MSYSRYSMLQKFVNGIPQQTFKQGELLPYSPFDTFEECDEGNASPGVTPDNPDVLYRWIASSEIWCDNTDEYKTEKQQQSADSGQTWIDNGATRRGEFVRSHSFNCGFIAERWVDVDPNIDFICESGNKYYLQKKQTSTDGVHWTDTGDTRKGALIESQSDDCGYPQTRWVEIPIEIDYVCVGDSKYYKEKEQITYDGIVWEDTGNTRRGRGAEVHSTDCGYVPPTVITRWVVVEGEFICQGTNKYQKQKEQISEDSGQTWRDTGNTRAGALIESDSYDCGYVSYRWVDAQGEFVCQGYDKYQKQNEEMTSDGQTWTPTGRTRTGALIERDSYDCQYVSYRWVTVTGEYVCQGTDKYTKEKEQSSTDGQTWVDTGRERAGSLIERDSYSCGYVSYRWVVVTGEYVCQGYNKFAKEKEQSSTDGQTWTDTGRTRAGALIEAQSEDCGYVPPTVITRWVDVPGEFVCQGYDKYQKQKEQISEDEGQTWQDTGNTRAGSLIEAQSEDCGYVPPTPVQSDYLTFTALEDGRFKFTKSGLSYSTDGTTWKGLAANTNTPTIAAGSKIYFKGKKTPSTSSPSGIGHFSSTGRFTASGTPMSLLFGDDFDEQTSLSGKDYAFVNLFYNCTKLTSIDGLLLPATTLANKCYHSMFDGCYRLTSIPSGLLPATTLADYCYYRMFWGCDGLTSIPSGLLPATTLAPYCYSYMFDNCNGLTSISTSLLPATKLATSCYEYMFQSCTGLTSIPSDLLPATTLAYSCYRSMFEGCTGLTTIPSDLLPATTLATYCYEYMFSDCTGLTSIPSDLLPATKLKQSCYFYMFDGCSNITAAPDLLAATLTTSCYNSMFRGCSNLNSIRMLATEISATNCLDSWVSGVASSGTFYKNPSASIPTGDSGIPSGWTVVEAITRWVEDPSAYICLNYNKYHQENEEVTTDGTQWIPTGRTRTGSLIETQSEDCGHVSFDYLTLTSLEDGNRISFNNVSHQTWRDTLRYSVDNGNTWLIGSGATINRGETIKFKGDLAVATGGDGVGTFSSTKMFKVSGCPDSLIFGDNYGQSSLSRSSNLLSYLFYNCTGLVDASELCLPAITIGYQCYYKMFQGCTSLITAPVLPATSLTGYCYCDMFNGCTSLTYIKMLATDISADFCLSRWVNGVASSGTFYKAAGVTIPTGDSGIPSGWTVIEV